MGREDTDKKIALSLRLAITGAAGFDVQVEEMERPGDWIGDAFRGGRLVLAGGGMRLVLAGLLVLACGAMTGCAGFFVYPGSITTTSGTSNTTTTLVSSAATVTVGAGVTLTATVSPSAATGTVTFYDNGGTSLGSAALSSSQATVTTSGLALGTQSLTAVYDGEGSYTSSTSSPVTVTASTAAVATTVAVSETSTSAGQATTLTATLSDATATGMVNFYSNGTTLLGRAAASGGRAVLNTTSLPVGSDNVTAIYSGDAAHGSSASDRVDVTVAQTDY